MDEQMLSTEIVKDKQYNKNVVEDLIKFEPGLIMPSEHLHFVRIVFASPRKDLQNIFRLSQCYFQNILM